jgi:1,4-dihydroxy-2-naphthoate polyprenyltransferase
VTSTAPGWAARWVVGARPRTLPASIAPVLVGAAAARPDAWSWGRFVLCAIVAVALQVGTNFANDVSDGVRGSDARRVGPLRLVASGLATPTAVRVAALTAYAIAAAAGGVLASQTSWWLVGVGVAALLAGWGYTGGPRPYGYMGLGEPFVFTFFGLVATAGTTYCVAKQVTALSLLAGAAMGLFACALLGANNLRDIEGDETVAKRTLAVRLGRSGASWLYVAELAGGFACAGSCAVWRPAAALVLVAVPLAIRPVKLVRAKVSGAGLLGVLVATARLQLLAGVALAAGLWLSS